MLRKTIFLPIEDDNVQKAGYGEGDVDGDMEDAAETVLLFLIFISRGDYHCQDYGDSCEDQFGDSITGKRLEKYLDIV